MFHPPLPQLHLLEISTCAKDNPSYAGILGTAILLYFSEDVDFEDRTWGKIHSVYSILISVLVSALS